MKTASYCEPARYACSTLYTGNIHLAVSVANAMLWIRNRKSRTEDTYMFLACDIKILHYEVKDDETYHILTQVQKKYDVAYI